jgi:hypothetical protein
VEAAFLLVGRRAGASIFPDTRGDAMTRVLTALRRLEDSRTGDLLGAMALFAWLGVLCLIAWGWSS